MMMCMMISGIHMMIKSRVYTQLSFNERLTSMYWPSVGWPHSCGLTLLNFSVDARDIHFGSGSLFSQINAIFMVKIKILSKVVQRK
jgi:hypothetical protein